MLPNQTHLRCVLVLAKYADGVAWPIPTTHFRELRWNSVLELPRWQRTPMRSSPMRNCLAKELPSRIDQPAKVALILSLSDWVDI